MTLLSVYLYGYSPQVLNSWTNLYVTWYVYIMVQEPISTAYLINPSHQSVCLHVYLPVVARQRLEKHVPTATNASNDRELLDSPFSAFPVVSKENLWVCLCIPLLLLGNSSVNTLPQQQELFEASFFVRSMSYQKKVGY
jgi:hypothetical protein